MNESECMSEETPRKMQGVIHVQLIRDDGDGPVVVDEHRKQNTVLTAGKRQTLRMISGLSAATWSYMRIGTDGTAPATTQTNVIAPVVGTLTGIDSATVLAGTKTLQLVISYPSGVGSVSANNIQEVCVLNSVTSPGGTGLMRAVFNTPVNKTTTDKLKITYSLTIA